MLDRTRLTRIITMALASCAVTWALAAGALARPDVAPSSGVAQPPAYKVVPGDTNKAPSAATAPAFRPVAGDSAKTPDPTQVQRVLNGVARGKTGPVHPNVTTADDDTGTIALITAIVAMLVALGAVSYTATRRQHPVVGA